MPQYAEELADNDLITTVASDQWLHDAQPYLAQAGQPLKVSMGIDTGMGRIGYRSRAEMDASLQFMQAHPDDFEYYG